MKLGKLGRKRGNRNERKTKEKIKKDKKKKEEEEEKNKFNLAHFIVSHLHGATLAASVNAPSGRDLMVDATTGRIAAKNSSVIFVFCF